MESKFTEVPKRESGWTSHTFYKPLHRNVLAYITVTAPRVVINSVVEGKLFTKYPDGKLSDIDWMGDWASYVAPVPGENHKQEIEFAKDKGSRLSRHVAEAVFGRVVELLEGSGVEFRS